MDIGFFLKSRSFGNIDFIFGVGKSGGGVEELDLRVVVFFREGIGRFLVCIFFIVFR